TVSKSHASPSSSERAPRGSVRHHRRLRWLNFFGFRRRVPSDPPVGGHSCNGGMIPRFHRVVFHYFTLWNTAGADCTVKSESRSRLPVSQNQSRVSPFRSRHSA